MKPRARVTNKKRTMLNDSDEDDDGNNELDIENKNIKNKMPTPTKHEAQETVVKKEGGILPPGKGRRKVKKSRCYFDDKGYMVNEDYSSYEEYDLP